MFCSRCGYENHDGDSFCLMCGNNLNVELGRYTSSPNHESETEEQSSVCPRCFGNRKFVGDRIYENITFDL